MDLVLQILQLHNCVHYQISEKFWTPKGRTSQNCSTQHFVFICIQTIATQVEGKPITVVHRV